MVIYIVVHSAEGPQRIACYDGRQAALEVAIMLHRESGREIEVMTTDDDGSRETVLCLPAFKPGSNGKG
jgi:hypothetical protein